MEEESKGDEENEGDDTDSEGMAVVVDQKELKRSMDHQHIKEMKKNWMCYSLQDSHSFSWEGRSWKTEEDERWCPYQRYFWELKLYQRNIETDIETGASTLKQDIAKEFEGMKQDFRQMSNIGKEISKDDEKKEEDIKDIFVSCHESFRGIQKRMDEAIRQAEGIRSLWGLPDKKSTERSVDAPGDLEHWWSDEVDDTRRVRLNLNDVWTVKLKLINQLIN